MGRVVIVDRCQRWRDRRGLYRPMGEPIDTRAYEIAELPDDATARAFVRRHHYSGSYPAARWRFGLYRGAELVGCAVYSVPVAADPLPGIRDVVELGRLVLLDDVPANGESWFVARCHRELRARVAAVVSYSDPVARTASDGRRVFPGHLGTVYQALNAAYLGRSQARTWRLLPDGTVLSARSLTKLRRGDRGWRYVAAQLVRAGADEPAGELSEWARTWVPRCTRPFRHRGTLRYAWRLDGGRLESAADYPKWRSL